MTNRNRGEPAIATPALATLAELPAYLAATFPKPDLIRRCRSGGSDDLSSAEVLRRVECLAAGLGGLGVVAGDRVAIVSTSRPEWVLADLAILSLGAISVPVYPTLAPAAVGHILADSGAGFAIVSDRDQLAKVQQVRGELPSLSDLVLIDGEPRRDESVISFETLGSRAPADVELAAAARAVKPEDLATIIYTSGTTGEPKGVMLTHDNLLSNIRAVQQVLATSSEDVALSFLPLSHSFERMVVYKYLSTGVSVAFAESQDTIARDLAAVRPTLMTGVPRVFEKLHARILEGVGSAPAVRRRIFGWALSVGLTRARARLTGRSVGPWLGLQDALADRLVFSKVRSRTGGRIRLLVSGSAPLAVHIGEFFFAMGLPIIEGYGLTETSPVLTVNPLDAPRLGTVGTAIPGVEVRIAADGEVLARGPNVMRGYYGRPDATREAIRDGWFHTGDLGQLDADGYLTITDRKKDLIITSGGKHVAPQPIEGRLRADPLVAEAILIGDRRRFVSVLLVPEFPALQARLDEGSRADAPSREALLARAEVQALYQEIVDAVNRDLSQFERIKRFILVPRELTIEGGELTPTLKVRRKLVEERWRDRIEQLYAE